MPQQRIGKEYERYRLHNIPADARVNQVIESRRSFYAGAWAFYQLISNQLAPGTAAEGLVAELEAFRASMRQGLAAGAGSVATGSR